VEFKEVVGARRSIRFYDPWRPVEPEKLQYILEASYQAPLLLGTDFVRVVAVNRDELGVEKLEAVKTPTTSAQLDMAPEYLFFFADLTEFERTADGGPFRTLVERGALTASHGWTPEFVERTAVPYLRAIRDDPDKAPIRFRPAEGESVQLYPRPLLALARYAIGVAQANALLACVDIGLATQLTSFPHTGMFTVPDTWLGAGQVMLVGYPGEDPEAGGQRPREPFEDDFHELRFGHPFYREPAVVERLRGARMIQAEAPFPWRFEEMRALAKKFGLPD
jgi:nitroreductase